ncbi:Fanconi anemia group D2 protein [Podochytrium sp. JEL0797]|nr:Fanconi anemia group D2 protein [Podochytrium sp. JEL0797]
MLSTQSFNKGKGLASGPSADERSFLETLESSGLWFAEDGSVRLEHAAPSFRRLVERRLKSRGAVAVNVKAFVNGLLDFISDDTASTTAAFSALPTDSHKHLKSLLDVAVVEKRNENDNEERDPAEFHIKSNYSVVKILLSIHELQPRIIELLVDQIEEFKAVLVPDNASLTENLPLLLLHQFRFMDHIANPKQLTNKLIHLLDTTSDYPDVQKRVIECIPEIMPDSGMSLIVAALQNCMERNSEVTVEVLDALGTVGVPSEMQAEITETVVGLLKEAETECLPVMLRFLLQTTTPETVTSLIDSIRTKMDFESIAASFNAQDAGNSDAALIFDALKTGIARQKFVLDAWIKLIVDLKLANDHQPIDVIVLTLLRSDLQTQKKVDAVWKAKIRAGTLSPSLVGDTPFQTRYFPYLLSLCETLTREGSIYHPVVSPMYTSSFLVFDAHNRQQLIGCLIAHIGSGVQHEIDCALAILLELTVVRPGAVLKFGIFVKGLLDYLDQLTINQIRVLYEIFASLALNKPLDSDHEESTDSEITFESPLLSDMRIIVRKQLGSDDPKFKQMGVVGAVSMIKRLASSNDGGAGVEESGAGAGMSSRAGVNPPSSQGGTPVSCRVAISFVLQVFRSCERGSIQCLALLFDELSYMISQSQLHPRFLAWIHESFSETFANQFLIDSEDTESERCGLFTETKTDVWFRLGKRGGKDESQDLIPETEMSDVVEATIMEYANSGNEEEEEGEGTNCVNIFPLSEWFFSPKEKRELAVDEEEEEEAEQDPIRHEKQLIVLMPACLRFLQSLEFHQSGGLEGIGVVLDMGVVMFESQEFSPTGVTAEACCSALFYAINYFHEILNAFTKRSILHDRGTMQYSGIKCLARVQHILELQRMLDALLPSVPLWTPIGFYRDGEAGAEELTWEDPTDDDQEEPPTFAGTGKPSQKTKKGKQKAKVVARFAKVSDLKPILRELEMDVFNLLLCPYLHFPSTDPVDAPSSSDTQQAVLGFPELLFLFSELEYKLAFLTGVSVKPNSRATTGLLASGSVGFSNLQRREVKEVVDVLVGVAPALCGGLEAVYAELRRMHEGMEKEDAEPENELVVRRIWKLFDTIIKCFTLIFQWTKLKSNAPKFMALLKHIASRGNPELANSASHRSQGGTQSRAEQAAKLIIDAHDYFIAFKEFVPSLPSSVLHAKLLIELSRCCGVTETVGVLRSQVSELAKVYMDVLWDEKPNKIESITFLLQNQIELSREPFKIVSDYIHRAFKGLVAEDAHVCAKYPLLDKHTFPTFFKIVFIELVATIDRFEARLPTSDKIALVTKIAAAFSAAVELSKQSKDGAKHWALVLKYSKNFMQTFVKRVLPMLGSGLKKHRGEVVAVFKAIQTGTRLLQTIANECKAQKDTSLLVHIPPLRKALEAFIFAVKKLMVDNEIGEAFFMANLKHKNLRGEQVSSQIEDSDQEDEDPVRDDESDASDEDDLDREPPPPHKTKAVPRKREKTPEVREEEDDEGDESNSNVSSRNIDELAEDEYQQRERLEIVHEEDEEEGSDEEEETVAPETTTHNSLKRKPGISSQEETTDDEIPLQKPALKPKPQLAPSQSANRGAGLSKHMTGMRSVGLTKGRSSLLSQPPVAKKRNVVESVPVESIKSNEYVDDDDMSE